MTGKTRIQYDECVGEGVSGSERGREKDRQTDIQTGRQTNRLAQERYAQNDKHFRENSVM